MSDSEICNVRRLLIEEAARYRDKAMNEADGAPMARWECGRGHSWDKTLDVAQNVRCMNCAVERRELETRRLREFARLRGGALLSHGYVDAITPLRWRCAWDHTWDARPAAASRDWCGECARTVFAGYR
ncbi:hypothetical protein AWB79_00057 [Caballeronia hypogeia]|uniref:Uncharacterized protein n=1 Tax=Caballeronia hypogeia TaxID=1777140 RepID=A0A157Z122_9BURK|nr:hypothetical protein [Caballeronia hypogeia]SAK39154.1 hypothetical protein AWB79_00057 [Caballeronia hypogeia]